MADIEFPKIDSHWRHHNGLLYRVFLHTNVEGTRDRYPKTIVYQNVINGKFYSRPLSDWHRSMTEEKPNES